MSKNFHTSKATRIEVLQIIIAAAVLWGLITIMDHAFRLYLKNNFNLTDKDYKSDAIMAVVYIIIGLVMLELFEINIVDVV